MPLINPDKIGSSLVKIYVVLTIALAAVVIVLLSIN
jgi:hypothetical protein